MPVNRLKIGDVFKTNRGAEALIKCGQEWKHYIIGKSDLSTLLMYGNTVSLPDGVKLVPKQPSIEINTPEGSYYFDGPDLRAVLHGKGSRKSVPIYGAVVLPGGV